MFSLFPEYAVYHIVRLLHLRYISVMARLSGSTSSASKQYTLHNGHVMCILIFRPVVDEINLDLSISWKQELRFMRLRGSFSLSVLENRQPGPICKMTQTQLGGELAVRSRTILEAYDACAWHFVGCRLHSRAGKMKVAA